MFGAVWDKISTRLVGQWPLIVLGLATPALALTALVVRPGSDSPRAQEVVSGGVVIMEDGSVRPVGDGTQFRGSNSVPDPTTTTTETPTTTEPPTTIAATTSPFGLTTTTVKLPLRTTNTLRPRTTSGTTPSSSGGGGGGGGPLAGGGTPPTTTPGPSGPALLVSDTFTGYGSGPFGTGASFGPWVVRSVGGGSVSTGASLRLTSASAQTPTDTFTCAVSTSASVGNFDLEATIGIASQLRDGSPATDDDGARVFFHGSDPSNAYVLVLGPGGWHLDSVTGGDATTISAGATGTGSSVSVRVRQVGGTIEVWLGGAKVAKVVDSSPDTSGSIGFAAVNAQVNVVGVTVHAA